MKTKLKKKGRNYQVIFPHSFNQKVEEHTRQRGQKQIKEKSEIEQPRFNRILHKSKEQIKALQSRSLSVKERQPAHVPPIINKQKLAFRKTSQTSGLDRTRGKSSIQISKIYYQGMQRYLHLQCEDILKQQSLASLLSPVKVEPLSTNLLFIKRKPSAHQQEHFNDRESLSGQLPTNLEKKRSIISIPSMKKASLIEIMEKDQSSSMLNQIIQRKDSCQQASLSNTQNDNESSRLRIGESRAAVLTTGPQHDQFNPYILSQLQEKVIFFLSSKFSILFTTFFSIKRVQILYSQSKTYSLSLLVQFYGQLVYKRISYNPSLAHKRKAGEHRRRGNLKKLQLAKDRVKERLLSHLMKDNNEEGVFLEFYEQLISYLEHYVNLQRTFRGLVLIDFQECALELRNNQKLWDLDGQSKSFYFMLKLSYTFYLIKVIVQQNELCFVFMCDFTTHSIGDNLSFSQPASSKFKHVHYQFQTVKLFLEAVEEFQKQKQKQLVGGRARSQQIEEKDSNAKIGKITTQPLETWGGPEVDSLWTINKEYYLMGELTNFFKFHNNFDYGYLNSSHPYNRVDQYIYSISELARVHVYRYPYNYSILKLTQIQQQTLLIPHIAGQLTPSHSRSCVKQFFKNKQRQKQKHKMSQWLMHLGTNEIRIQIKQNQLQVFMQSSVTLRCNKVLIPLEYMTFNRQNKQPNMQEMSLQLQRTLKSYKLVKRFIYSRPSRHFKQQLQIYQKRLQKFEGHYAYVTLYGLPLHGLLEFKMSMFRLARQFVISVDREDSGTERNYRKLSARLVALMKTTYLKKLLQMEAQKIKQRRIEVLQDFLKHHGKNYVKNSRSKIQSQRTDLKRRTNRLPTIKMTSIIYENIISEVYRPPKGPEYYITMRYFPSEELRQLGEWKNQMIEICVHREQRMTYFKCVVSLADLVDSVSQGKLTLEQIDYRKAHDFFIEVHNKIKVIISATNNSPFNLAIDRLRNFIIPNQRSSDIDVHPFKFRLASTALIEGKDPLVANQIQLSQLSIQLELERHASYLTSSLRHSFLPIFASDQIQTSVTHFSFNCLRNFEQSYMRSVGQDYYLEVVSIFRKSDNYNLLRQYKFVEKQVLIVDKKEGFKRFLGEWEAQFVGDILLKQYNKRMFRRLVKAVGPLL